MNQYLKIVFLGFFFSGTFAFAQMTENFKNLALDFKQLEDISSVGSYEMLGNLGFEVEQNLAWKFLFDQNQYLKVEETFAHPVGWYKLNDKIAILFFYQGKPTDTKYILSAITMKYTDDKIIDKLPILGTFSKDGSTDVCKLTIKSKGNFRVESRNFSIDSLIDFLVKNNGKFEITSEKK
jgi:hypothetical protein